MNIWNKIVGGSVSGIIDSSTKLVKVWRGDKSQAENNMHMRDMGMYAAYAAEAAKPNRNWFDSLIDGANRIVRPLISFGVMYAMYLLFTDAVTFAQVMLTFDLIPVEFYGIIVTIIGFYFGARELQKGRENKRAVDPLCALERVLNLREKMNKLDEDKKKNED